jgi:electron transfer flavoprotein beta subunit
MNSIVCIKQVPDTTEIKIDPQTNTLIREGVESIINPFDLYAIEEAVQLKEKFGGKVTALSMGPPQVEKALRDAVALGVDEIILLSDRKFAGADSWATSHTLSSAIKKLGDFDLIFFGQQAIDGDTGQVGPGVAAFLNLPQVCFVKNIAEISEEKVVVHRLMEEGYDVVEVALPAVLSVVKDLNTPRLPSLRGKRTAKKAELSVWNAENLGLDEKETGLNGSPTQVVKIFSPKLDKEVEKLEDLTPQQAADKIFDRLKELGK